MKFERGLEILKENEIGVEESTVMKNGNKVACVQLGKGKIRPTVYKEFFEAVDSKEEMLKYVNSILNSIPEVDVNSFFNKEFFLENCISCVRHQSLDEETVKFSVYGDLEEYIRVRINKEMSIVVTCRHLSELQIDADEIRTFARRHLAEVAQIRPMSEVMASITGKEADFFEIPEKMWVASTEDANYGAAVILLRDELSEFCKENDIVKLCIIPSSVHEAILTGAEINSALIDSTICEINSSEVLESEQLSTHCYFFEA